MSPPVIAVIGSGDDAGAPALLDVAREVGAGLAAAGATVICGGLGGVMAAASEGAAGAGGTVIGLLPGDDAAAANPAVTVSVATGLGEIRNALIVRNASAVIAIGGGYGTLSESGFALKSGTPVIGLSTWELRADGATDAGIIVATSAAQAVSLALGGEHETSA